MTSKHPLAEVLLPLRLLIPLDSSETGARKDLRTVIYLHYVIESTSHLTLGKRGLIWERTHCLQYCVYKQGKT